MSALEDEDSVDFGFSLMRSDFPLRVNLLSFALHFGVSGGFLSKKDLTPAGFIDVLFEGGDIRYRVDVVERYLKSRERGNPTARKGSAQ